MHIGKFLREFLKKEIKEVNITCNFLSGKKIYVIKYIDNEGNLNKKILSYKQKDILDEFFNCLESKIYSKNIVFVSDADINDMDVYNIETADNMKIKVSCLKDSNEFDLFKNYINSKRKSDCYSKYNDIIEAGNTIRLLIQEDKETDRILYIKTESGSNVIIYNISSGKIDSDDEIDQIRDMINDFIEVNGSISKIDGKYYLESKMCINKTIVLKNGAKIVIKGLRLIERLENILDKIDDNQENKKLEIRSE